MPPRPVNEPNEHEQRHVCVRSFNFKQARAILCSCSFIKKMGMFVFVNVRSFKT
ncbi:hypothetical protein Hanom_Chr14g01333271 [Helianthus anomalus]